MTFEEKLDRLAELLNTLAGSVVAHDEQIEQLIKVAEKHDAQIAAQGEQIAAQGQQIAALERQWQAYINTLPRH